MCFVSFILPLMSKTMLICAHKNMPVSAAATSMTVVWNLRVLNIVCLIGSTASPLHLINSTNSKDNPLFRPSVTEVSYFSGSSFTLNDHELFVGCQEERFKVKGHLLNMLMIVSLLSSTLAYLLNYLYTGTETHIYLYTCTARMCVLHTSKRQLLKDGYRWLLFYVSVAGCTYLFWWLQLRGNALEGLA